MKAVSVVIPVHNERESIVETVRAVREALESTGRKFEIVVVDDGSTDGSADEVARGGLGAILVRHEGNRGYGAALKSGFARARLELVAFLDADGTYSPSDLPAVLDVADKTDMAVGVRGSDYKRHASFSRRLGKAFLQPLANYTVGWKIPDLNSGMRAVRRDLLDRYWPLFPNGFSLTTTLTMTLLAGGWGVEWVPISYSARRGRSKIHPVRDMSNFILVILRTITYFRPLRVYLPASALFVVASVAVVLLSKYLGGQVMDVTALFLFIFGLQLLLIGVLADLVLKILGTKR
ncbi:glycosyltransferase family 2 protein [Candidatus Sumerlaeota bacterium]|nr:glycosyltransferase family 2 protein [Candidatus Sumerlaeota bacterium]